MTGYLLLAETLEKCDIYDDVKIHIPDLFDKSLVLKTDIKIACCATIRVGPILGLGALTRSMDLYVENEEIYSLVKEIDSTNKVKINRNM